VGVEGEVLENAGPAVSTQDWLSYLESERQAARETAFRLSAVAAAVPATVLAVLSIEDYRASIPDHAWWIVLTLVIWAEALTFAAMYLWYQLLGTLKWVTRSQFDPEGDYSEKSVNDYDHLMVRDAGFLLQLMSPWTKHWKHGLSHSLRRPFKSEQLTLDLIAERRKLKDWNEWSRKHLNDAALERLGRLFEWSATSVDRLPERPLDRVPSRILRGFAWVRTSFLVGLFVNGVALVAVVLVAVAMGVPGIYTEPVDALSTQATISICAAIGSVILTAFLLRRFINRVSESFAHLAGISIELEKVGSMRTASR